MGITNRPDENGKPISADEVLRLRHELRQLRQTLMPKSELEKLKIRKSDPRWHQYKELQKAERKASNALLKYLDQNKLSTNRDFDPEELINHLKNHSTTWDQYEWLKEKGE
jgi:hypothetical protein